MHCLRDCEDAREFWTNIINPEVWSKFFSIGLNSWLDWNLSNDNIGNNMNNWSIFFGVAVNELWKDRNSLVFSNISVIDRNLLYKINTQVSSIINLHGFQKNLVRRQPGEVVAVSWKPPPDGWHKVNVDGSFNTISGSTACGGLIRNQHGIFLKGFYSKIGSSNAIWAEMWALRIGIRIAQNMSLPKVVFEMDSKVIVNMVTSRHTNNAYLSPLLGEIIDLLQHPNWETSITHVYREANRCADFLANRGHSSSFDGNMLICLVIRSNSFCMMTLGGLLCLV
jgi:ribonuclease HI